MKNNFSKKVLLLLHAALDPRKRALEAWLRWLEGRSSVDFDSLPFDEFRLLPFAYLRFSGSPYENQVYSVRGLYRYFWSKNVVMLRDFLAIYRVLKDKNIPVIFLKGAAQILKNANEGRVMNDVDILVSKEHFFASSEILRSFGYGPKRDLHSFDSRFGHSVDFEKDGKKYFGIDLHCRVFGCGKETDESFWKRAVELEYRGEKYRVLSKEDELLMLLSRIGGFDWDGSPDAHARYVIDAVQLFREGGLDWNLFCETAKKNKLTLKARAVLVFLEAEFAVLIPKPILSCLRNVKVSWIERLRFFAESSDFRKNPYKLFILQAADFFDGLRSDSLVQKIKAIPSFFRYKAETISLLLVPVYILKKTWKLWK